MNKSEQRQFEILASQLAEERRRRVAAEQEMDAMRESISEMSSKLDAQVQGYNKMAEAYQELMKKMTDMLFDKGPVTLPAAVVEAFSAKVGDALKQQRDELNSSFELRLQAKDEEIAKLKKIIDRMNGGNSSDDGSKPGGDDAEPIYLTLDELPESLRERVLKSQKKRAQGIAFGQRTESEKYNHGSQQVTTADDCDMVGIDMPDEAMVIAAAMQVKGRRSRAGEKCPRREQPLFKNAKVTVVRPDNLPEGSTPFGDENDIRYLVRLIPEHMEVVGVRFQKFLTPDGRVVSVRVPKCWRNPLGNTQITISLLAKILQMHFEQYVTIGDIEKWLQEIGLNYGHATVIGWFEKAAKLLEPLDEPLRQEILATGNVHADESTHKLCDQRLPNRGEKEEDVEPDEHFFKRWLFSFHAPLNKLVQYLSFKRGRRKEEAVRHYLRDLEKFTDHLYFHCDAAVIYLFLNAMSIVTRISCQSHMRRPFYYLKDCSTEASHAVKMFDAVFAADRKIKEECGSDIERQTLRRKLELPPLLHELKSAIDKLRSFVSQGTDPDCSKP